LVLLIRISLLLALVSALSAQDAATLTVNVTDPSGAPVPGARLALTDTRRGTARALETIETGFAIFDHLQPGTYSLEAEKAGFDKIRMEQIVVSVRDRQALHLDFRVAPAAQTTITVTGQAEGISADPAAGISVDSEFLQYLPINGRSPESLILMTPGITSAAGGKGGMGFNTNGLRENTNYHTLDGVSVMGSMGGGPMGGGGGPMGGGGGGPMGGGGGGGGPMGGGGMISMDAMQEMRVQTSSFAPEFGRSPGAQISMTSRGGGNDLHGSLFDYVRNDRIDANDWFANSAGYARGELRQNRFGGVLGGPVLRDRTFFFASYEGLRLRSPVTVISNVPNMQSRISARPALRPYLNAFPIPNGPMLTGGAQQFRAVISNPSVNDSGSLRIDHTVNSRWSAFARYSQSASSGSGRGSEMSSPNVVSERDNKSKTLTVAATHVASSGAVNDLRVNTSESNMNMSSTMDDFGGAVPLTEARMFPSTINAARGQFSLNISGTAGYSYAMGSPSKQSQVNVVDSLTKLSGTHHFKTGLDVRRITPTYYRKPYSQSVTFRSLGSDKDSLLTGVATSTMVTSNETTVYPIYLNFSAYGQDSWRISERTTFTYGLRWDVNPAPGVRKGPRPFAKSDSTIAGVTQLDPLYQTRWFDVAPRLGLAYQMDTTPGREMIFRLGSGLFYDAGSGVTSGSFGGAPYSSVRTLTSASFPLTTAQMAAPSLPPTRPYGQIVAADTALKSPRVLQYSAAVERMFGAGQSLTIGYAGTRGDRLLRTEMQPSFGDAYDMLSLATNGGNSWYNGLQAQFRRRLRTSLQMQFSYTYAHSIDSASNDMGGGGFATIMGSGEKGSSDFDIRHSVNVSGSWFLPGPRQRYLSPLLRGWFVDWIATARTGLPMDVRGISTTTSNASNSKLRGGVFAQVRPDYNGLPLWIADANVPGGRRLNSAAFEAPDGYAQGNLGRNAIRGFGAAQLDFALRRQVARGERWRVNLSAQAYNALNHPNFANPSSMEGSNLSSPNFGIATRMIGGSSGGGSPYSSGGSRSLELALRLQF
jgi:hypothetical protein